MASIGNFLDFMARISQLVSRTGPYSREGAIARPARRTKEARFCNTVRKELTEMVGTPSATQKYLIERIVMMLLRIELMDKVALRNDELTDTQSKNYLAWTNTASRMLRALGMKSNTDATFSHLDDFDDAFEAELSA